MSSVAALYARISSDPEGKQVGVANQEAAARRIADAHGLTVSRVYIDNDASASTNSRAARPEFDAMLEAAERGEFDTIIAYSMSRLTRRPAEWERLIDLAQTRGVRYLYEASPRYDLNTADGRATARTVAAWDAAEAERTSERRKFGNAAKTQKGIPAGRPRVFGFEPDGMTPREDEAELLRAAYASVIEGATVREVARTWNAAGSRTTRGGEWSAVATRRALLRERNAGILVAGGEVQPVSQITPIVDADTFEVVRSILTTARPEHRGRPSADRYLSGVATCSCGAPLVVGRWASRGQNGPAYVCQEIQQAIRTPGRKVPPGHARIKAELLEEGIHWSVLSALRDNAPAEQATPERRGLIAQRAAIAEQLERAKGLYAEFGAADDLARARKLQAEHDAVTQRIDALSADTGHAAIIAAARAALAARGAWWHAFAADDATFEASESAMNDAEDAFLAHWGDLDADGRRALVRATLAAVRVNQPGDERGRIQIVTHADVRAYEAKKAEREKGQDR